MPITSIQITGYRGPKTDGRFLPAGDYQVGKELDLAERIVPDDLARYLVDTGQVIGFEVAGEHPRETAPVDPEASVPTLYGISALAPLSEYDRDTLEKMSPDDLRNLAKAYEIELPAGRMKKPDLIELIIHAADQPDADDDVPPDPDDIVQPNFGDDSLGEPDSE